ncbi:phage tail protein [Enterobacter hormaechei]|uniref:phage tail fiber protein n=1 Tax=Enterobacter hormaechei TaxID=158836 RepID=UPI001253A2EA|nr:phage tail protein [Enterobacter hormaechei]QLO99572.1 phage tail protein [Enterobacter hormaechei]VAM34291.1 Uncharacterised protein [Enterobacter hormaechei]
MSAGTLTLTNNSAAVTGSGTAFTTELAVGDFIVVTVGGIPYTLAIKTVNSNTSLTLVSNYTGPTQAGAAWYAVPRVAMNLVTAALVAQSAEALRGLNYDKQNWQRIFSGTGNVTVTLPDGSSFTGPAWSGITSLLAGKLDKSQNLNDVADKAASRTNLGLDKTVNTEGNQSISGEKNFTGPLKITAAYPQITLWATAQPNGTYGRVVTFGSEGNKTFLAARQWEGGNNTCVTYLPTFKDGYFTFWTTSNTTVTSDGTIKQASPIARIVKSQGENRRTDVENDGFTWCGCGTANAEAEGVSISRLDTGVYELTGSAGLASDGWQLLPPMDPGGKGELGVVEAEQTENGGLTIRLFKRKYMLGDDGEIVKTKGEPMDVPANSWIDVRLDMPDDSAFNQRMSQGLEP